MALVVLVAALAAAAGLSYQHYESGRARERALVDRLYSARLPDVRGTLHAFEQWRGRVLVVNFWATWCTPCRQEIPGFVRLQARHGPAGLQFIGVAVDNPAPVAAYAKELNMNYPALIAPGPALDWMRLAGNAAGVLPYTLVLDRAGRIVHRHRGILPEEVLNRLIGALL